MNTSAPTAPPTRAHYTTRPHVPVLPTTQTVRAPAPAPLSPIEHLANRLLCLSHDVRAGRVNATDRLMLEGLLKVLSQESST